MRTNVIIFLFNILLLGCQQKKSEQEIKIIDDIIVTDAQPGIVDDKPLTKFERLLRKIKSITQEASVKLSKVSKDYANAIYEDYAGKSTQLIDSLNIADRKMLEEYHQFFYNEKGEEIVPTDTIQKKVIQLQRVGLEYRPDGEGMGYITTTPEHYYEMFRDYVSSDYREFLKIKAEQDKVALAYDAGLNITIEEVGKRVLEWEQYLKKHPWGKLAPSAKEQYEFYQMTFLLGMDNTPAFDYSSGKLNPENKKALQDFIAKHPDSFTSKLAKIVLDSKGETADEVRAKVEQIQKQERAKKQL